MWWGVGKTRMTPVWMPRHHWTKTRSFWNRSKAAILRDLYLAGGPGKEINALIRMSLKEISKRSKSTWLPVRMFPHFFPGAVAEKTAKPETPDSTPPGE